MTGRQTLRCLHLVSFADDGAARTRSLPRTVLYAGAAATVLMAAWCGASAYLLLFRDQLLSQIVRDQAAQQQVYEDRIAAMRAQVDRIASRQLVDQDGIEGRLADIASRQAQLESRGAMIAQVLEHVQPAGATVAQRRSPARAGENPPVRAAQARPPASAAIGGPLTDVGDATAFAPMDAKPSLAPEFIESPLRLRSNANPPAPAHAPAPQAAQQRHSALGDIEAPAALVRKLSHTLLQIESNQISALADAEAGLRRQNATMRSVVSSIGLDPARLPAPTAQVGGPFEPIRVDPAAGPFERQFHALQGQIADRGRLRRVVAVLPVRRPLPALHETSSGYGPRIDPFTRAIAMHSGLDFRGDSGDPVRATGGGTVMAAAYTGGYGNMVEIDHGHGLTTRYAHLSAILVSEGTRIEVGQIVGRLGSTGRSTGPHLHYETRIDGDAVDPQRFLKVADKLAALR